MLGLGHQSEQANACLTFVVSSVTAKFRDVLFRCYGRGFVAGDAQFLLEAARTQST